MENVIREISDILSKNDLMFFIEWNEDEINIIYKEKN